ncbi:uncharacterized protein LOC129754832 [Uranotaenia lowii]|uniref:uncharacterized protein LOC129754832 n=1 Tax=Uranotaenia lowii TaxID=190385 RepID=UPI002479F29B|nr:uncharacterized protein LOC129754832 [Uranotaenia lowii]
MSNNENQTSTWCVEIESQVPYDQPEAEVDSESSDKQAVEVLPPDVNKLIIQRNHSGNRITHIIDTINAFQNDVVLLETRRDMLKQCYRTYDNVQSSLEQSIPDEMEARDNIELKYIAGLATFEKLIASLKKAETTSGQRDSVRLPTIDLPIFTGANDQWLEWIDKFNSLIHNRPLPIIQKFEYLKVSLRGSALAIVDSLPTTEGNYKIAYDLLYRRFNNPKQLVQQHIRQLFELKPMESESAAGLRELLDAARKHLRCLESLAQPVQTWDAMLIHLISNKLDPATRRQWETAASGISPPTYEQLEGFVLDRCQVIDAIPIKRKATVDHQSGPPKRVKTETRAFVVKSNQNKCAACKGNHFLGVCDGYRMKSVDEKFRLVKRFGLCFNCLASNHTAESCRGGLCRKCKGRHHTSLHRDNNRTLNENLKTKRE